MESIEPYRSHRARALRRDAPGGDLQAARAHRKPSPRQFAIHFLIDGEERFGEGGVRKVSAEPGAVTSCRRKFRDGFGQRRAESWEIDHRCKLGAVKPARRRLHNPIKDCFGNLRRIREPIRDELFQRLHHAGRKDEALAR